MPYTAHKTSRCEKHDGTPLGDKAFDYKFDVVLLVESDAKNPNVTPDPVPAGELTDDDLRAYINQKRTAKENAKARQTELESRGLIVNQYQDADKAFETMVRVFIGQNPGMSKAQAEESARRWMEMAKA